MQPQRRERRSGGGGEHELHRVVHEVENRERRGGTRRCIRRTSPARSSVQVACDVRGTGIEDSAGERVERVAVDVVDDAEIPARRPDAQHLGAHAQRDIGVGSDGGEGIVARCVCGRTGRHRTVLQQLDGDPARRSRDRRGVAQALACHRRDEIERDLAAHGNGRRNEARSGAAAITPREPRQQRNDHQ